MHHRQSKRRFLVGGNWKMNGDRQLIESTTQLLWQASLPPKEEGDILIAPPYPYLALARETFAQAALPASVQVCAQSIHHRPSGAFTGEVSIKMLADLGIEWTLIGHSERRSLCGETDELVGQKLGLALEGSPRIHAVVCIGETLPEREAGQTDEVLARQLAPILGLLQADRVSIAYEPVWAIGTGRVATTDQVESAHASIRSIIGATDPHTAANIRIIYGGSVTAANCRELAKIPDLDGFLVGGASLKPEFADIVAAVRE